MFIVQGSSAAPGSRYRLVPASGREGGGSLRCDRAGARRIARSRSDIASTQRPSTSIGRAVASWTTSPRRTGSVRTRPRWGSPVGRSPRLERGTPLGVGYARVRERCSCRRDPLLLEDEMPWAPWRTFRAGANVARRRQRAPRRASLITDLARALEVGRRPAQHGAGPPRASRSTGPQEPRTGIDPRKQGGNRLLDPP